MPRIPLLIRPLAASILAIALWPALCWATQTHGEPEGLYAHQFAHLFFIVSMGIFEYSLRQRNLVKERGWRYLQFAAILLILWNLDAAVVHFLDEQVQVLSVQSLAHWQWRIITGPDDRALALVYYLVKLDHLLAVPAMICLYKGLRRLLADSWKKGGHGEVV